MNLLDLIDVGEQEQTVVRLILKRINITHADLWQTVENLPPEKRMNREDFERVITALLDKKWMWKSEADGVVTYSPRMQKRVSRLRLRYELNTQPGTETVFGTMWNMLEQRLLHEKVLEKAGEIAHPNLATQVSDWLAGLSAATRLIILMVFISLAGSLSISTLEIVGLSGFVRTLDIKNLPWLWVIEMLLGLGASVVYVQFADRLPRMRLMKSILAGLAAVNLLMMLLFLASTSMPVSALPTRQFNLSEPRAFLYPLLYLLRSLQIIVFPIALWNLANNLYPMAEARKTFPKIAAGGTVGGLLGYLLFTRFFGAGPLFTSQDAPFLLGLNVGLFLLALVLAQLLLRETKHDQVDEELESASVQENIRKGLETLGKVPLFRYLSVVVMLNRITFTVFIFHNLLALSRAQGIFESLLSLFGIVSALLPLVLQWQVVPRLTGKVETQDAFLILPVTLALGMLLCALLPNSLWVVVIGLLIGGAVSSSWDYPTHNTLQNLIPEEHRPQVSALLGKYLFALGQIVGAIALLVIFALTTWMGLPPAWFYLPLGLAAALGSIWAAVMVRRTYTDSMQSWRMTRRTRAANILDKLD